MTYIGSSWASFCPEEDGAEDNEPSVIGAILELLRSRADFCCSASFTTSDTEEGDWKEKRPLYRAQSHLLHTIADEIGACVEHSMSGGHLEANTRWIVASEIGGPMTARLFETEQEAYAIVDAFANDHSLKDYTASHGRCSVACILIPARRTPLVDGLDIRYAHITWGNGAIDANIIEVKEAVIIATERFDNFYDDSGFDTVCPVFVS